MNGFKKSDLETGYILTFDDDRKGIVIKDINGDTSQSLFCFIKDNKIDDVARINTETNDDLYCRAYKEKNLVKVEKLEDEYLLGELLKPSRDFFDINSIPKTVIYNRELHKGDVFYVIKDNISSVIEGVIDDIYILNGTTVIVDAKGNKYSALNIYATESEAVKAYCI